MSRRFALRDCQFPPHAALVIILSLYASAATSAAAPPADPLAGKWWGTAVAPHETVDFGLEFKADGNAEVHVMITQPGANYFGLEYPGVVQRDGNRVTLDQL